MREHFESIVGIQAALDNPNDLLAYSYDASGREGKARIVLFPSSEEHIRKILTYANRTNIPIVPRGLGTNALGQVVPENSIVIDMARFDRTHTVNLKEGWVHVDAGVVVQDLQNILEKHGYTLPVTPKSITSTTIGALIATNQMDRKSHKKGRIKDHVLSIEIIDGSGKHFVDGNKDFIGMEGCGAIILRAKIKIYEQDKKTTSSIRRYDDVTSLLAGVEEFKQDLTVLSLEYLNPIMAKGLGMPAEHTLLIEYASEKGDLVNQEQQDALWGKRMNAWDVAAENGYPFIEDCQATPEQLYDILQWCEEISIPVAGHIGQGILHPFFDRQEPEDFYHLLESIGAEASGQFGYGLVKKRYISDRVKNKLIKLKDEYDYNDIINRGKIHDYV